MCLKWFYYHFRSGNEIRMSEISPLVFLLKLAWDCRFRLPLLITVGFMVLDVRMQLDINVQMRQIPRARINQRPNRDIVPLNDGQENRGQIDDNLSDSKFHSISLIS